MQFAVLFAIGAIVPFASFATAARVRGSEQLAEVAASPKPVPKFTVDLDVAPEERWKEVILYYRDRGYLQALYDPETSPIFRPEHADRLAQFAAAVRPFFDKDPDVSGEVDGWVHYGNVSGLTRERVMLLQILYESNYPTFCSGLLAAKEDGTVIHGRNLDFFLTMQVHGKDVGWADLTTAVTMLRGGQPFIDSVIWPTQLTMVTGMRYGGWTFQQNTRRGPGGDVEANLAAMLAGGWPFGLKVRRIMEEVADYDLAVEALSSAYLAAPSYFVVSGPKPYQGAILSVDRLGYRGPGVGGAPATPPILRLSKTEQRWHLLETNSDWNGPDRPFDMRRPIELAKLAAASQQDVSVSWVLNEMKSAPLMMAVTTYTWVADVSKNFSQIELPPAWVQTLGQEVSAWTVAGGQSAMREWER